MYKKVLMGLAVTTVVFSMTGCNHSENVPPEEKTEVVEGTTEAAEPEKILNINADNKLIWCITPAVSNPYFQTIQDVAQEKGEELGYTVTCESHDDSVKKQKKLFEKAIKEKASFIICDNADAKATAESVQKAYDAGIGVFLIDREMEETGIAAAQIVADNEQGALEVARYLVEQTGGIGDYAELVGLESDINRQIRHDTFYSVLNDTDMVQVAEEDAGGEKSLGKKKVESILKKNPQITAIVCGNDAMACGAAEAVKEAYLDHEVYIIGIDGSNEMRDYIKEGFTTATALQQIDKITRDAVEQGDKLMQEGATGQEEKQLVDCRLINGDNADKLDHFVYTE